MSREPRQKAFEDENDCHVVPSLHLLMEGDHQRPCEPGEARVARPVLIGRNQTGDAIADGIVECRAVAAAGPAESSG
jgi:hypothetical protein